MTILHASFNYDVQSHLAFATRDGYSVLNINHLEQNLFETSESGVGCIQIFRSNGTVMVAIVGSGDLAGSSPRKLKILDVNIRKTVCELSFLSSIISCSINSHYIAVCLEMTIHIIELNRMKTIKKIQTPVNTLGIMTLSTSNPSIIGYISSSTTGKFSIINLNSVNLSIISSGDVAVVSVDAHRGSLACLQLNSEGTYIASASITGTIIRVFDTKTGLKISEFRRGLHHAIVTSLLFCPSDSYLIVGSSKGSVHIFKLYNGNNSNNLNNGKVGKDDLHSHNKEENLEPSFQNQDPRFQTLDPNSDIKPRNILGSIFRAAFTSVQIELKSNKQFARASFIARIPSLEGPICMNIVDAGNGMSRLYVVTASGYLYRFRVPISLDTSKEHSSRDKEHSFNEDTRDSYKEDFRRNEDSMDLFSPVGSPLRGFTPGGFPPDGFPPGGNQLEGGLRGESEENIGGGIGGQLGGVIEGQIGGQVSYKISNDVKNLSDASTPSSILPKEPVPCVLEDERFLLDYDN